MSPRRPLAPLLAILVACGWPGAEPAAAPPSAAPPTSAVSGPTFTISAPAKVDGAALRARLTAPADHVQVFNFWATWCGPCIAELPTLLAFARSHPQVELVLINVDHASQQDTRVKAELEHRGLLAVNNLLLDSRDPNVDLKSAVADWPESIPTTVVVGRKGERLAMLTESIVGTELERAVALADHP